MLMILNIKKNPHTHETLQNNTTMHDKDDLIHDEYDTSEDENVTEIQMYENNGEPKLTRRETPNYQL